MQTKEGKAVRITDEAHKLLVEKAKYYNVAQKEIASEAILVLYRRDERIITLLADVARLKKKIQDNKSLAFVAFVIGVLSGIITGVML